MGAAGDFHHHAGEVSNGSFFDYSGLEGGACRPLVGVALVRLQPALTIEQGHFGRGAGAAGRAVHMGLAVDHQAPALQWVLQLMFIQFDHIDRVHFRPFRMGHLKLLVGFLDNLHPQCSQGVWPDIGQMEIELGGVHHDEKTAHADRIHLEPALSGHLKVQAGLIDK